MNYAYLCIGGESARLARSKGLALHHLHEAARRAGITIDEELIDRRRQGKRPLVLRPKGFALDQRLVSGDAVVTSIREFGISASIDTLTEWTARGVRVVVAETAGVLDGGNVAAMIPTLLEVVKCFVGSEASAD